MAELPFFSLISSNVFFTTSSTISFQRFRMLSRDDNCVNLPRFHRPICFLQIFNCNLRLAVRPQPPEQTTLTHICQLLAQSGGHGVSQRHAILSLVTCIPEHDALIASSDIKVLFADMPM